MARTATGTFPIGFRRGWGQWQRDLPAAVQWAKKNDFEHLDLGPVSPEEARQVTESGLQIGSFDLKQWPDLASPDAGKRAAAAAANAEAVKALVPIGVRNFFAVVVPEEPSRSRKENYEFAVAGWGELCRLLSSLNVRIVLEGWPGQSPHYASLACTPVELRAFLKDVGSEVLGVNFDPSHLIRMNIDPVRFLGEFASIVYHVHAKDTELLDDDLYEFGDLQQATFAKSHGFGGHHWRYTIPGHGAARWAKLFRQLHDSGYRGRVSIELEDENFNGSTEGEQRGLLASRDFLKYV